MAISFAVSAQSKIMELKQKNNFMLRMHQNQNFSNQNRRFKLNLNPYWESINAPHVIDYSFVPQITVPTFNVVWGRMNFDTVPYNANRFLRTTDGGRTWRYDSVDAPANYAIGNIAAIDANTCYASIYNGITNEGVGIYKTIDGGDKWKQIGIGQLFKDGTFNDFVYFFDAQNGLAVGDGKGNDSSYIEIYTTSDAGKTWQRVHDKNIPLVTGGTAYSFPFDSYTVYKNIIWFLGYDDQGNSYIYRSDDLGSHWQLFPYTLSMPIYDFAFTDKKNGLAVSFDENGPHEAVTHDGGATWTDKSFKGYPMGGFIAAIPGTHTLVTTLPGPGLTPVYGSSYSNDLGASWNLIDSGINAIHSAVAFLNPLFGWTGRTESEDPNGGMFKWKLKFSLGNFSFTANKNDNNVLLNWQVENETGNDYYSVERSADGINFSAIGQVKSYNDPQQQYIFEDNNSTVGQQYYRLKEVNNDGDISYSNTIKIDFGGSFLKLYPNPANDILKVEGLTSNSNAKLSVIDVTGRIVQQVNTVGSTFNYNVQKLAAGSYYLKVETNKQGQTLKFVKE